MTFSTIPDVFLRHNADLHQEGSCDSAIPQALAAQPPPTPPIASGVKAKARALLAVVRTPQTIEQAQRYPS